jgi:hypothetical protein
MAAPTLYIKKELHYRHGYTDRHCSGCDHYVANPEPLGGFRSTGDGRCRVMGLKPGRAYRILPGHICDRFDQTKTLARLKAGTRLERSDA